ncbi:hypothetical protein ABZ352_23725 [Streptomyces griseofuscus]|uniref:hypothetical protein n=1 Tax=Streptomyces griseofuscus TaxID=146922 RepID=UPI0033C0C8C4
MPENEPTPPAVNEHGYPDATPVAEMTSEHQAAYWRYHSKKWEQTAKSAPDSDELTRLRERDAELKKIEESRLTDEERTRTSLAAAETAAAEARVEADKVARRALVLEIALEKGLTVAQAERLRGSTKEELETDADELKTLFGAAQTQDTTRRPPTGSGSDVKVGKSVAAGEARYKQRHGTN